MPLSQLWDGATCSFRIAASPQQQELYSYLTKIRQCHVALTLHSPAPTSGVDSSTFPTVLAPSPPSPSTPPRLPPVEQLWTSADACAASPRPCAPATLGWVYHNLGTNVGSTLGNELIRTDTYACHNQLVRRPKFMYKTSDSTLKPHTWVLSFR